MSESEKDGNQNPKGGNKDKELSIIATVDPKQLEDLVGQVKEKELEVKDLQSKLETATTDKDSIKTKLDEAEAERNDFKSKLSLIAKQELEKKKAAIMVEAGKHIKDEARLKAIADGIKTHEDLKPTEFLIDTIKDTLVKGAEQHKEVMAFEAKMKALGAPDTIKSMEELEAWEKENKASDNADPTRKPSSGTLTLAGQNTGGDDDGYGSHPILVRDLRRRSHSEKPEEAAEAKAILQELFRKWTVAVKKEYEGKSTGIKIEKGKEQASLRAITKEGGAAREEDPKEGN